MPVARFAVPVVGSNGLILPAALVPKVKELMPSAVIVALTDGGMYGSSLWITTLP